MRETLRRVCVLGLENVANREVRQFGKPLGMAVALTLCLSGGVQAAPQTYMIDPGHTYPSFEADHAGLSLWRGKFNKTTGSVTLDREAKTGTVDLVIDASSMDFGHNKMNEEALSAKIMDVEKYPEIAYKGTSMRFDGDKPVEVIGELTMKGKTLPVNLTINRFVCKEHRFLKREVCGADAQAKFNRADFGVDYAVDKGFDPEVMVRISIEAVIQEPAK